MHDQSDYMTDAEVNELIAALQTREPPPQERLHRDYWPARELQKLADEVRSGAARLLVLMGGDIDPELIAPGQYERRQVFTLIVVPKNPSSLPPDILNDPRKWPLPGKKAG